MSGKKLSNLKTWIELSSMAAEHNYKVFRGLIGKRVRLWAVVKSNAYGHGIFDFAGLVNRLGIDGFCVDSVVEGMALRDEGITKPILVLGPSLPGTLEEAAKNDITISVSSFGELKILAGMKNAPAFHIKLDTGMHRRGFYLEDVPKILKFFKIQNSKFKIRPRGLYTHFASAKDINYPTYTEKQFKKYSEAVELFKKAGFTRIIKHVAATGGTLIDKKYHLNTVRVGIGLYGLWPSKELEMQLSQDTKLKAVLSWKTKVGEIKSFKKGDYIGYDLAERIKRRTKAAILPIGYWHGFPRSLSGIGEVIIKGKRTRVLGRVSMDLMVVDVTGIVCEVGDIATLIGRSRAHELCADDVAAKSGTSHYEFLTRINPLIKRTVK